MSAQRSWFSRMFSSDHRGAARHAAPGLVAYYWEGTTSAPHQVQNISSTGFYLLTRERWHPGTIITMTLQKAAVAGSTSELYIAVQTKVVRLGENGVGLSFIQSEPQDARQSEALSSKPVGKKALERFLDQLLSEQGYVVLVASRADHRLKGASVRHCLEETP
ncbi:hypothetical protein GCM10011507_10920 [Edaphobacter acidisoli]|uniref:PilZ domain-containing protein n=1 Tax=Edaphobacter acidisoli TaxID=2040573 RepID=A0A916W2N1_9BACT|nr:PilZ domain-containing protein [Edaphobacter acidisoli]GGA61251.1 hypothetical protein GCM10011507_10920 [Edaphobacter acidisoli]